MPQYLFRPRETLILNYYWLSYISIFRTAHKYVDDTPHICRGYTLSSLSAPLCLSLSLTPCELQRLQRIRRKQSKSEITKFISCNQKYIFLKLVGEIQPPLSLCGAGEQNIYTSLDRQLTDIHQACEFPRNASTFMICWVISRACALEYKRLRPCSCQASFEDLNKEKIISTDIYTRKLSEKYNKLQYLFLLIANIWTMKKYQLNIVKLFWN